MPDIPTADESFPTAVITFAAGQDTACLDQVFGADAEVGGSEIHLNSTVSPQDQVSFDPNQGAFVRPQGTNLLVLHFTFGVPPP
jgi:hypothetical protein